MQVFSVEVYLDPDGGMQPLIEHKLSSHPPLVGFKVVQLLATLQEIIMRDMVQHFQETE